MDEKDQAILNEIQTAFPIAARPYQVLGQRLGLGEEEVLERVNRLRASGVIRRLGGNFSAWRLGYASTLCAATVPAARLEEFTARVNALPGVTHNYIRDHEKNVWFTMIAPSRAHIEEALAALAQATGVEILDLPAEKTFKIRVDFRF